MPNEVRIDVTGRDTGAKATLTGGARAADELGNRMKRAGDVARGVLAAGFIQDIGRAAQRFLGDAMRAASGLEQAVGGTKAVFGDASAVVDDFGKKSAQAVGLSEREFREATTLIGGQLKRMTGDVNLAADSSIQLVEVGADLAATYGGTTKQAVDAFAAALRGEADPAERFNLNLKVSAVNAKAVELGLAETTNEVDDNARAQALLALVMEQSADAQGQFAREADTAAVASQKATAQWENAQATLGQVLLPLMAKAASVVSTLAEGFGSLPGPVQAVTSAAVLLGAGLLVVLPRIAAAKVALAEMGITARLSGGRMTGFVGAVGRTAAPLAALVAVSGALQATVRPLAADIDALVVGLRRWADTGKTGGEAVRILGEEFSKLDAALLAAAESGFDRVLATAIEGVVPLAKNIDDSLAKQVERVEALDAALAHMVRSGQDTTEVYDKLRDRADELGISEEKLTQLLPEYTKAQEVANAETKDAEGAHGDAAEAADDQRNALQKLNEELRAQADPMFALIRAQQDLKSKQDAYNEALREHGRESPEAKAALLDMTEAALDMQGAAGDAADTFGGELPVALKDTLRAAGFTKREIRDVEEAFVRARRDGNRFAGRYRARVDVRGARAAERSLERLNADLRRLRDRTINVNVRTNRGPAVPFAHGGLLGADEPAQSAQTGGIRGNNVLVGESGPEIVELPFGSRVIPSGQSRAMLRAAEEMLGALGGGRTFFEDFSFRGSSANVGRFNDFFAQWFYGGGGDFNRREIRRFLRGLVDELERPRQQPRPPAATGQPGSQTFTADGGKFVLEVVFRGDGSSRSDFIMGEVREAMRVNATFRRELAEVVRR